MTKLRTVIITHNEPLFLRAALEGIFKNCSGLNILGIIKGPPPAMIKGNSIIGRARSVFSVFGFRAFIFYGYQFIWAKISLLMANKPHYGFCEILSVESVNSQKSIDLIKKFKPDLILSILAGEIFGEEVIKIAPLGILNVHTGQLPKYKGLMPTFWALKEKEPVIGISSFLVNKKLDGGKVLGYHPITVAKSSHFILMTNVYTNLWASINMAIGNLNTNDKLLLPEFLPEQYFSSPSKDDVDAFLAAGGKLF